MKMDRNVNADGLGKYAVINLRKLDATHGNPSTFERWTPAVAQALKTLEEAGALEWGCVGQPDEFFLIKLRDRYAFWALMAYAEAVGDRDTRFAAEVRELAGRSSWKSPHCKTPD